MKELIEAIQKKMQDKDELSIALTIRTNEVTILCLNMDSEVINERVTVEKVEETLKQGLVMLEQSITDW